MLNTVVIIPEEPDEFLSLSTSAPQVSQLVNHLRRKTVLQQNTDGMSTLRSASGVLSGVFDE